MYKTFKEEFKKNLFLNWFKVVSFVMILIIPMIYAVGYIFAYWDPFDLNNFNVAIVNNDVGSNENNEEINIGKQFIDVSSKSKKVHFIIYDSLQKAKEDLYSTKDIYGVVEVDKDFTKNVTSISDFVFKKPILNFYQNSKKNYFAGIVNRSIISELNMELSTNIVKSIGSKVNALVKDAPNKVEQLSGGISKLNNGINYIENEIQLIKPKINDIIEVTKNIIVSDAFKNMKDVESLYNKLINSNNQVEKNIAIQIHELLLRKLNLSNDQLNKLKNDISRVDINSLQNKLIDADKGFKQIADGTNQLVSKLKVAENLFDIKTIVNNTDNIVNFIHNPIEVKKIDSINIKHYGFGFAPFAITIALWVGVMILFFVIDDTKHSKSKRTYHQFMWGKFSIYCSLASLQAIILTLATWLIGMPYDNIFITLLSMIFCSLVFTAIQFTIIFSLGQIGKVISMLFLILQISSSGGTYPIQLSIPFYKAFYNFIPFSYVINAFREVSFNVDIKNLLIYLIIPTVYLIGSLLIMQFLSKYLYDFRLRRNIKM